MRRTTAWVIAFLLATTTLPAVAAPHPVRVVSLAPSLTELVYALGAQADLVGDSDFCDYPPAARRKPHVGGAFGLNVEAVVALKPDVVLAVDGDATAYRRAATLAHARLVVLPSGRLDAVFTNVRTVGALLGRPAAADALVARMRREIARIAAHHPARSAPRVFYLVWGKPLMTAAPGSYLDDLVRLAGGVNVVGPMPGDAPYPAYSWETLVAQDPDVIVAPSNLAADLKALERERPYLRAVRTHHLRTVDPDVVSRPGPRLPQALTDISDAIWK